MFSFKASCEKGVVIRKLMVVGAFITLRLILSMGEGIAKRLVYAVIDATERKGVSVTATCSYALNVLCK